MDAVAVREALKATLAEIAARLTAVGKLTKPVPEFGDDMVPHGGLQCFDSQIATVATVMLQGKLGVSIPDGENVFAAGSTPLSIKQIIDRVIAVAKKD
jgi:hypothetical protein